MHVVVLAGPPCAGKTTLVHRMAKPGDVEPSSPVPTLTPPMPRAGYSAQHHGLTEVQDRCDCGSPMIQTIYVGDQLTRSW